MEKQELNILGENLKKFTFEEISLLLDAAEKALESINIYMTMGHIFDVFDCEIFSDLKFEICRNEKHMITGKIYPHRYIIDLSRVLTEMNDNAFEVTAI